jgi:hypothetical protein
MTGRRAWIACLALLAVAGGAAGADELVTRDGQVIRTQGPWEVRGRLLVFKLADGTLASLRLDEADLEATEQRAQEAEQRAKQAREAAMKPTLEPKQAAMVLTDNDVAHAPAVVEEAEPDDLIVTAVDSGAAVDQLDQAGQTADTSAGEAAAASGRGVQVVQWSQESEGEDGVAVRGVIQNLGTSFATSLSVNALFYDEAGSLVAAREVEFEDGPLGPGARRGFSVSLPHSLVFDEIKFQVVGRGFRSVGQSVRTGAAREPDAFELP